MILLHNDFFTRNTMFNLFTPDISKMNMQQLMSQVSPEQAAQIRSFIVDHLLQEKNFNENNPFIVALKNDKQGDFKVLKDELVEKINTLPESHPAKKIIWN